jgi:hypothetical protein
LGERVFFFTSQPPDDGSDPTGYESTVTSRIARSQSESALTFDTANGWAIYELNISWSVSGSAVLTHWGSNNNVTSTAGPFYYEALPISVNVQSGDTLRFAPYKMKWRFSDVVTNRVALTTDDIIPHMFSDTTHGGVSISRIGLSSTTPTRAGTNITEPVGGGYARAVPSSRQVVSGVTSYTDNTANWTFPTATAPWSGLTHWVMFDAVSGGNALFYGALDSTVNVLTGETPQFLTGDWKVSSGP